MLYNLNTIIIITESFYIYTLIDIRADTIARRAIAIVLIAVLVLYIIPTTNIYSISVEYNNSIDSNNSNSIENKAIIDRVLNSRISFPFIANIGQYDHNIRYYTDTFLGRVLIYNDDIVYMLKGSDSIIRERLIGSNILLPNDKSITSINYL